MNFYSLQIMVASIVCGLIIGLDVREILSNNTIVGYEWLNAIPVLPAIFSGVVVWYLFVVFGNLIGDYSNIIERMLKIDMDDDGSSPTWWLLVLYYVPILIMIIATYLLSIGLAGIVN